MGTTRFSPAGLDFLRRLEQNNTRTWFEANKTTYHTELLETAVRFVADVGERLQEMNPTINYDTRTNGSGSLMRIHRDTRFSADKSPYKSNISGMWWQGDGKKTRSSAYGFQLESTGMKLMAGMFGFDKPQLDTYRAAVLDDTLGTELADITNQLESTGDYMLSGEHYKRVPRGCDPEHPRARWLRFASLHAFPSVEVSVPTVTSERLVDAVITHFRRMEPLQQWLVKAQV